MWPLRVVAVGHQQFLTEAEADQGSVMPFHLLSLSLCPNPIQFQFVVAWDDLQVPEVEPLLPEGGDARALHDTVQTKVLKRLLRLSQPTLNNIEPRITLLSSLQALPKLPFWALMANSEVGFQRRTISVPWISAAPIVVPFTLRMRSPFVMGLSQTVARVER